jgi:hypothetical protein
MCAHDSSLGSTITHLGLVAPRFLLVNEHLYHPRQRGQQRGPRVRAAHCVQSALANLERVP